MTIIAISGLSGTGKTTLGKKLVEYFNSCLKFYQSSRKYPEDDYQKWIFIDQDSFYKKDKPLIRLKSGKQVKNWDSLEAIDFQLFNDTVISYLLQGKNIIVVGFALWKEYLHFDINYHILLSFGDIRKMKEENEIRCFYYRQQSKKIDPQKEIEMIQELVIPFYVETLQHLSIDQVIDTFHLDGKRKTIEGMLSEIPLCVSNL